MAGAGGVAGCAFVGNGIAGTGEGLPRLL